MRRPVLKKTFALIALALVLAAPLLAESGMALNRPDREASSAGKIPIYALARANGLSTLADAVEIAGLARTLNVEGPLTVFAPTNEAFAALPPEVLEGLLADPEALADVLLYHVAPGRLLATDVILLTELEMANGQMVTIDTTDGVKVNNSNVILTDVLARNGVVHVIDAVLVPPTLLGREPAAQDAASFGEVKSSY
jgi:uncharacterized surface protein with fasciclin (FAS1) repeats